MKCLQCGTDNSKDAKICDFCSNPLATRPGTLFGETEIHAPNEVASFSGGELIANRYQIVRELGRGGMGVVYYVKDTKLEDKELALKMISPALVRSDGVLKRFIREVLTAQELQHKNIVRVFHLDEFDGAHFFTMEYLAGQSLRELMVQRNNDVRRVFSLTESITILDPVVSALSHAHSRQVIHRDLKPENIIINGDLPEIQVKVVDFGLARIMSPSRMTSSAMSMGTAYYMSPEQLAGKMEVDARSDIFAIGVIFYELLTGMIPTGLFKMPSALLPRLPKGIDDIIGSTLATAPEERYQSVKQLQTEFPPLIEAEKRQQKEDQRKAKALLESIDSDLRKADFEDAAKKLDQVSGLATGMQYRDIQQQYERCKKGYTTHIAEGRENKKKGLLDPAKESFEDALKVCSESDEASSMVDEVQKQIDENKRQKEAEKKQKAEAEKLQQEEEQRKIKALTELIDSAIRKSGFDNASEIIDQLAGLAGDADYENIRQLHDRAKKEYSSCIDEGLENQKKGLLAQAKESFEAALKVCPESDEASRLMGEAQKQIKENKARLEAEKRQKADAEKRKQSDFERFCKTAENSIKCADFSQAKKATESAESLFPEDSQINKLRLDLNKVQTEYENAVSEMENQFAQGNYDQASASLVRAKAHCPDSGELRPWAAKITSVKEHKESRQLKTVSVICAVIIFIIIIGVVFSLNNKEPEKPIQPKATYDEPAQTSPTKSEGISPSVHQGPPSTSSQRQTESKPAHLEVKKYSLTVRPNPSGATIRILNIEPRYYDGISLEPDDYHIRISKTGYRDYDKWVTIKNVDVSISAELEQMTYAFTVRPEPSDATVRILNIDPRYYDGIKLSPGRYQVEVSKSGYKTSKAWVELKAADSHYPVTLKKVVATIPSTISNSLGMKFVYIKSGTFMMGSDDVYSSSKDKTQKHVTLTKGYYLQTTEVTQGHWRAVMGSNPSKFSRSGDNHPVEQVSWTYVQDFIRKLNAKEGTSKYRLPTEAEWEYACRAGSSTEYCYGYSSKDLYSYAWYGNNSNSKSHLVAQKKPNAWGLYDMHGNVWEWCSDWHGDYPSASVTDPEGPSSGSRRVYRSGSWSSYAQDCRSADRYSGVPDYRNSGLGFRLARTP